MPSLPTIALISVASDPATETGSQNVYVRQIGEGLSRLGWQVDMFTRQTNIRQKTIVQHNPRCRTIRLKAGVAEFISGQKLTAYLPKFLLRFEQFQQEHNLYYRLIHTNSWLSGWVGLELKKKQSFNHVHTFHSLGAVKYAIAPYLSEEAETRLAIEKACLETADLTLATCPQQKEQLRELVSPKGCIAVLPYGTNTKLFGKISRAEAKAKLNLEPDLFNILYVGKFNQRHGIETLIKAVSKPQLHQNHNLSLTLVNNTSDGQLLPTKRVEKMVEDQGIAHLTTLVEELSPLELGIYYAAADVCIVPSQDNPSGLVALQAMASGTPVIAANVDALKYIVEHEKTGLLFPAHNSFLLTKEITRLITKNKLRSQLATVAQNKVRQLFTWEIIASQLSALYGEQFGQQNFECPSQSLQYSISAVNG